MTLPDEEKFFISMFNLTVDSLIEDLPPKAQFIALKELLQAMRDEPMEELIPQKMCESMVEVRILTIMVQELQASIAEPTIKINLN